MFSKLVSYYEFFHQVTMNIDTQGNRLLCDLHRTCEQQKAQNFVKIKLFLVIFTPGNTEFSFLCQFCLDDWEPLPHQA